MIKNLHEPGPTHIRELSESYLTFFEIVASTAIPDAVTVEELGTGKRYTVLHVRELFEIDPKPGEIWFARRVGTPDRSIFYTTPYIYEPETRTQFKKLIKGMIKEFKKTPGAAMIPVELWIAESQKEAAVLWAEFILRSTPVGDLSRLPDEPTIEGMAERQEHFPTLVTTDGEDIVFVEVHFRIKNEAALRKRLSTLRSFDFNEQDDSWSWLKAKSRKYPDAPRTVLGYFRIQGDCLIAETNSQERAGKLHSKLKGHLRDLIAYEKTLYRDPYDFPERTPEEIEAREKKSKDLHSRPEVQEALKKHIEHHYFNVWPTTKIPALGGLSPRQAARSKKGRAKLEALIDDIERSQISPTSEMPSIDIEKLRRLCGLPPKGNEQGDE
jgi:hypothetical protein